MLPLLQMFLFQCFKWKFASSELLEKDLRFYLKSKFFWNKPNLIACWHQLNFSVNTIILNATIIKYLTETVMCVCVCVFIFFHHEGFFRLQNVQDILEGADQRSCVVNISWLRYAKFHHPRIWKCHISPPKTKTPAVLLLERKRYDIMRSAKRWYILI